MENFRLRVFRAVARHLSFRLAAEELLLTQPAVSQQVHALESELGTPLFDRSGGRVRLTPAGAALLPFADRLQRMAVEAREAVAEASGAVAGQLAVAASQTIGQYLLPRLVAGFLDRHPRVELHLSGGNTQTVLEELRGRRVQIALIEGPAPAQDLLVVPFMQDHMVLVVPPAHEWADSEVALGDLASATLLTRELGSGSRRIVEQALEDAGMPLRSLRFGLAFDSTEGLLSAVEAGLGIAFVSRWAVRNQLALGTLRVARVQGLALGRMFSLVALGKEEPGGTAGSFWRFVLEQAETLASRRVSGGTARAKAGARYRGSSLRSE